MSKRKSGDGTRIVVTVRNVEPYALHVWEEATESEPETVAWAKVLTVREYRNWKVDIQIGVDAERYGRLTAGLVSKRARSAAVGAAFNDLATILMLAECNRDTAAKIPAPRVVEPPQMPTILQVWSLEEAASLWSAISQSKRELGCGELVRYGPIGRRSVLLALSLPPAIFSVAARKYLEGPTRGQVSRSFCEAVREAWQAEPRPPVGVLDDEIPF